MKRVYSLILLSLALSSCKYVEVMSTRPVSPGIRTEKDFYVFENDTVQIIYLFWGKNGQMSFTLKNKLDVPIYIDWKKSSLVLETKNTSYYAETEQSNFNAVSVGNARGGRDAFNRPYAVGASATSGSSVSVKAERVTFIAPHSHIERRFGDLTTYDVITLTKGGESWGTFGGQKVVVKPFRTPILPVRNFISYSTTEDFKVEHHIDNAFEVDKLFLIQRSKVGNFKMPMIYKVSDQRYYHTMPYYKWQIYRN